MNMKTRGGIKLTNTFKVNKNQLRSWLRAYERGSRSKVDIEREELDNFTARGKVISRLWRNRLGVETVTPR